MNLKDMQARMSALSPELESLSGKMKDGTLTDDESARTDAILLEVNDLGEKITRIHNTGQVAERARTLTTEPAGQRASGLVEREGGEEAKKRDFRAPVERFLDSEEFKRFQKQPRGTSGSVEVGSFHTRVGAELPDSDDPITLREIRALITSSTPSGSMLMPDVFPTIYRARERDLVMRDVLINASTTSDSITILQESGFTNNAAEVAEATTVSDGAKPESALTFTEVSFPVRTIAHWVPITRQTLDDLPFMRTYVEERLRTGLLRREDNQILNGNGTPPNLTGLLLTSGIQVLDAAYFTGAPVVNVGMTAENFNRILRAKRLIRTTGGAQATFVVVNPTDMEQFLTYGDANRQYYGPGPFSGATIPNMWGLQVVESENIAADTALVGDGTMAAVVDRQDATIYMTDSHSDFFIRNILVILAEERLALPCFRPAAFAKVTLVA